MKNILSGILIALGLSCIGVSLYPLLEMNQEVKHSLAEWELLKVKYETLPSEEAETPADLFELQEGMIGVLQLSEFGLLLPIRSGVTETVLKQGVGFDPETAFPGEVGNTVLYGHREQIFWNLKETQVGDLLILETLDQLLTFEVTEMKVIKPNEDYIYQAAEEPTLTLVTCYPFIYMGPTPERYVVKATLKDLSLSAKRTPTSKALEVERDEARNGRRICRRWWGEFAKIRTVKD